MKIDLNTSLKNNIHENSLTKTMENLTYQQRCFIWASGFYLSEEVDPDFYELSTEEQFESLEQMAWEPFENYRGKDIYQYIHQLAYEIQNKLYPMEND
tara:strand:+ start:1349 stop:1642 length:294 start_codon:yes stop_codon:yes gene_type:complete